MKSFNLSLKSLTAVLTVFLCVFIFLCSVPAYAEDEAWTEVGTLQELNDAIAAGGNIRLIASIENTTVAPIKVPTDTEVVLDLNGFTLRQEA